MSDIKNYISKLDTDRFGFNIAKVEFEKEKNIDELILFLKQKKIPLIITKVNCENISLINQLEKHGFSTMDFQVGYDDSQTRDKTIELMNKNLFPVRKIQNVDVDILVSLSENLFNGFGHYFADVRLDKNKCLEIYKDWTRNVCTKEEFADIVFAAYDKEIPVGYFAFKQKETSNSRIVTGVIGAVSSAYSGKGIFQSLILQGVEWAAEKGLLLKDVKVHNTNYPINAAFSKLGFRISNSCITMHCWNDDTI